MDNETDQDPLTEALEWVEALERENADLRREFFIANEVQLEMRQLLANTQFELAATKAQLKYATQPTA